VIPYDIDPSLHTGEPEPPLLDDGFSPPHPAEVLEPAHVLPDGAAEAALGEISPF
jgi:hypothetical protein